MKWKDLAETKGLVTFSVGAIPIILAAPHGGTVKPGDISSPRSKAKGYKTRDTETFEELGDVNTYELLSQLAQALYKRIGKHPYVVAANFDRAYIDANRNNKLLGPAELTHENHAYDDPAGEKYYSGYHKKIGEYVEDIRNRFKGEGLLFDIHGSTLQAKRIVVGMVNY
ncbi:MAG: N-formylglutamate amidohydrolase, partial [bacterium]|nr:N-formylglutamate amidohydrolase [bacterium]